MDRQQVLDIKSAFTRTFLHGLRIGTLPDGDGSPVQLVGNSATVTCSAERIASFGCPPDVDALLVSWVPAGMTYDAEGNETGFDLSQLPDASQWVSLPAEFQGLKVYYARGHMAVAAAQPKKPFDAEALSMAFAAVYWVDKATMPDGGDPVSINAVGIGAGPSIHVTCVDYFGEYPDTAPSVTLPKEFTTDDGITYQVICDKAPDRIVPLSHESSMTEHADVVAAFKRQFYQKGMLRVPIAGTLVDLVSVDCVTEGDKLELRVVWTMLRLGGRLFESLLDLPTEFMGLPVSYHEDPLAGP